MIAIDSCVIIDVLRGDPVHGRASALALTEASALGSVVICDAAMAEVCSYLDPVDPILAALAELGIHFSANSEQAAVRAGHMQFRHRQRSGKTGRTVADFLIGAHAMLHCQALITRDQGFFRDYFTGLKLIIPAPPPTEPAR